jgi:hypothetical protein
MDCGGSGEKQFVVLAAIERQGQCCAWMDWEQGSVNLGGYARLFANMG